MSVIRELIMTRLVPVFLLAALVLAGCGDASLKSDVAQLQAQVAALQDENTRMRSQQPASVERDNTELNNLLVRLERAEGELRDAREKLARLEKDSAATATVPDAEVAEGEDYAKFKAMRERAEKEEEAEREQRRAEQRTQRQAQMQEFARRAKEAGLEFDADNPRQSGMQIWLDPQKREKAVKIAVDMFHEQRLKPLNLTEQQAQDVLRIEAETRHKVKEVTEAATQSGATPEEVKKQADQVRKDQEQQMKGVLSPEQYEEYEKSAAEGGMLPGTVEELGGMIPPGMIPGMGGGQGR
jgi:hypothetical protein